MANFCGKCGRQINETENVFSLSGYGTVCAGCYQRSANAVGKGSLKGNIWTTYFKAGLYLLWGGLTIGGLIVGGSSGGLLGVILFGGLSFVLGFMGIASVMIFITMAEDISVIRKNAVELNRKLQK